MPGRTEMHKPAAPRSRRGCVDITHREDSNTLTFQLTSQVHNHNARVHSCPKGWGSACARHGRPRGGCYNTVQGDKPATHLLVKQPGHDGQGEDAGAGQDVGQVRVRVVGVAFVLQLQPRRTCTHARSVSAGGSSALTRSQADLASVSSYSLFFTRSLG